MTGEEDELMDEGKLFMQSTRCVLNFTQVIGQQRDPMHRREEQAVQGLNPRAPSGSWAQSRKPCCRAGDLAIK